jgi:hypothetical protein
MKHNILGKFRFNISICYESEMLDTRIPVRLEHSDCVVRWSVI